MMQWFGLKSSSDWTQIEFTMQMENGLALQINQEIKCIGATETGEKELESLHFHT